MRIQKLFITGALVLGSIGTVMCTAVFAESGVPYPADERLFSTLTKEEALDAASYIAALTAREATPATAGTIDNHDVHGNCGGSAHIPGMCGGECVLVRLDGPFQLMRSREKQMCTLVRGACRRLLDFLTCYCDYVGGDLSEPFRCVDGPPPEALQAL